MALVFRVNAEPVPQPRPRVARVGAFAHAYVPKEHPIHGFRGAVRLAALAAGVPLSTGYVEVSLLFVFKRPASHFKSDGSLRSTAPAFPGQRCGDADNLAKGILDALRGVAFPDDCQADLGFVRRRYGRGPYVEILVDEVPPGDVA